MAVAHLECLAIPKFQCSRRIPSLARRACPIATLCELTVRSTKLDEMFHEFSIVHPVFSISC